VKGSEQDLSRIPGDVEAQDERGFLYSPSLLGLDGLAGCQGPVGPGRHAFGQCSVGPAVF